MFVDWNLGSVPNLPPQDKRFLSRVLNAETETGELENNLNDDDYSPELIDRVAPRSSQSEDSTDSESEEESAYKR